MAAPSPDSKPKWDPVYLHSLREAQVILSVFAIFGCVVLMVSFQLGARDVEDPGYLKLVFGLPHWIFWGVVLPWLAANLVTAWFCFGYMQNDELADESPMNQEDEGD